VLVPRQFWSNYGFEDIFRCMSCEDKSTPVLGYSFRRKYTPVFAIQSLVRSTSFKLNLSFSLVDIFYFHIGIIIYLKFSRKDFYHYDVLMTGIEMRTQPKDFILICLYISERKQFILSTSSLYLQAVYIYKQFISKGHS